MAKANTLFGAEELPGKPQKHEDSSLPLIPTSKKKASKNDTPMEKEIRRFNKLIKDLHEYEAGQAKQREYEEAYDRLFQQKLIPEIQKLAKVKFQFVQHVHYLFEKGKFTKPQQRHFVDMVVGMLSDVVEFVPEAKELSCYYLNRQVELMTKKDKQQLNDLMQEGGYAADLDNFDIEDMWEHNRERMEQEFLKNHTENARAQREEQQNKKAATQHQEINVLYRELARLLHPDLEQDEGIRQEKEQLMKDLSRARQHHDLHTMLLIKAKAQRFGSQAGSEKKETGYSLDQLKRYNKELKKKLDDYRANFMVNVFNNFSFDRGGFITGFGKNQDPEKEIAEELKEIKATIRDFQHDMKQLQTPEDLKYLIETDKRMQREHPFGWGSV